MIIYAGPWAAPDGGGDQRQIDLLARWKGNQYYFYSETNIELQGYPLVVFGTRYTQNEIRRIIAYGRQRHVDVIACLELYAHLHELFRIERHARLAPRLAEKNRRFYENQASAGQPVSGLLSAHLGADQDGQQRR